ncbi:hypothetical protein B5P46_24310 [Rhizobium leguminosarum]|uniref:XdhC family protein n=1 Tax=Rhizobium leguminosarum TaxID=384 RepID=A0A4Q1TPI5_RHILE|nr:XdhC family protein [Rhizobium leguminosarum]RXT20589.1 hypothetical protein B5P46_24310 [Rhizobium leguminosarum]
MQMLPAPLLFPTPVRSLLTDDPAEILAFAFKCHEAGMAVALATLVSIRGGAARPLGSHVAVAADGRFCGYVSGGCVEAAVAAEALLAMAAGEDRLVLFGEGSTLIDIVLPCGGGLSVAIHLLRDTAAISQILNSLNARQPAALAYVPARQSLSSSTPPKRSGWRDDAFLTLYRPRTRLVLSGQTLEAETVGRLAEVAGYEVVHLRRGASGTEFCPEIDLHTAIVLLHHDLDQEEAILNAALQLPGFYIGALGSTRTHQKRVQHLKQRGYADSDIDRIKAPIGMFGPARDASSLALSVLADVAASRLMAFGP